MRKRYEVQGAETDPLEDIRVRETNRRKNSIHHVSASIALIFLTFLLGLYGMTVYWANILPTPLKVVDEKLNPDAFITERAHHDLKLLTSIGPRGVGFYENEVLAVDFLKREIMFIQQQAHQNQKVELDIQTVSGSYFLDYATGFINSYANVQNVIVKLHSRNYSDHSLLINAHFDSVPTSPGGSDDGINCVAMLEILRKLSRSAVPPDNNIIFLFNGAEESPLQASHGFITQHKWAKEIKVVINLEAAGSGYKEILFQAGPGWSWLLNYYGKVPHPNGHAAGEELFQSGLIPSDTDFRIFRDFGNTIGMDLAFTKNGYRYHTKFDDFASIPLGSYQHVGDNALSLVRNMANAPELRTIEKQVKSPTIFFDYMGIFLVHYSETTAIPLNIIIAAISTILALKSFHNFGLRYSYQSFLYLGWASVAIVMGWIIAGLFVILTALILDLLNFTMSWYNNPWIVFGLYIAPTIACSCASITILNHFYNKADKSNLNISAQAQIQGHLMRLIWAVPLLLGTILHIRAVYLILFPLAFQTLSAAIIEIFNLQQTRRLWIYIYILGTIAPNLNTMKAAYDILSLFIPISGRMGSDRNPEFYIGGLVFLLTILIMSYYTPLSTLVDKPKLFLTLLFGIFLFCFVIVLTPIGFPYNGNPEAPATQRFWIQHTSRTFRNDSNEIYKRDAGFYLFNMDHNSPATVKKYVKDLSKAVSIERDCANSLFCGLAVPSPRAIPVLKTSTWMPAEQPILHEPINLRLNSKTQLTDTITRFNFSASGPNTLSIYISPKLGVNLTQVSLVPDLPSGTTWNDREIYIIFYTCGAANVPLTFTMDFETAKNWGRPTFDIALTGMYKYDKHNRKTPHFLQFLNEFPNWTDVIAWLAAYESWVY